MASKGQAETEALRTNLESQLERLIQQLRDLEDMKDELDEDEYKEGKEDTIEQLKELNESLKKMMKGDLTLLDKLGLVQLATQAAISEAFKTPEVIRMFARREPGELRQRLSEVERDFKLGQSNVEQFTSNKREILTALRQLGERLTVDEIKFLDTDKNLGCEHFVQVTEDQGNVEAIIKEASKHVKI